jgi:uncharacterized membrane protein YwaF
MLVRNERGYVEDMVAGSSLILVGIMLLVDRLGNLILRYTPRLQQVQQWWPLVLIVTGVALLISERARRRS